MLRLRQRKPKHPNFLTVHDLEFEDVQEEEFNGPEFIEPKREKRFIVQNVFGHRAPTTVAAKDEAEAREIARSLGYGRLFSGGILVTYLGVYMIWDTPNEMESDES